MIIIGCDFHTRYQQIAMADDETGELLLERRLDHESGEAHAFYRNFSVTVRVGIEATGPIHWFERLLARAGADARFLASAISRRDSLPAGFGPRILSGIMPFFKRPYWPGRTANRRLQRKETSGEIALPASQSG